MYIKINPKFFLFKDMFYLCFFFVFLSILYGFGITGQKKKKKTKMKHSKGKIKEWRTWQETGYVGEENKG